jgi:nucleotide-binding universal stress UspA family protein
MSTLPWSSILVATAWTTEDHSAFLHGLALALAGRTRLTVAHVGPHQPEHDGAPSVRAQLARWGVLPAGAPRSAVAGLGLDVIKAQVDATDPLHGLAFEADVEHVDLVVLGHRHRDGLARLLNPSLAARAVRELNRPVLVIPDGARGFIDAGTGERTLRRVVVAVDHRPSSQPALDEVASLIATLGGAPPEVVAVHVGPTPPAVDGLPPTLRRDGAVVEGLLAAVAELDADLLVLATEGRVGARDVLFGSTTERVLAEARLPLLVAPQRSF